jgi:hypothetical protein
VFIGCAGCNVQVVLAVRTLAERARALIQVAAPPNCAPNWQEAGDGSCDASGQVSSATFPA